MQLAAVFFKFIMQQLIYNIIYLYAYLKVIWEVYLKNEL